MNTPITQRPAEKSVGAQLADCIFGMATLALALFLFHRFGIDKNLLELFVGVLCLLLSVGASDNDPNDDGPCGGP